MIEASQALPPLLRHNLKWIAPYLELENVTDIHVNRPEELLLIQNNENKIIQDANLTLKNLMMMSKALATQSGQVFSEKHPSLSCALPGYGYRIQINGFDTVASRFAMSIRIGQNLEFPLSAYVDTDMETRLKNAVLAKKNVVLSGATGAGKTTFANALIKHIPIHERVLTIEDPLELVVPHENQVRFTVSRHDSGLSGTSFENISFDLLRHNPERFIFGELEMHNILAFLKMLNSGHGGTFSTLHANSPKDAMRKLVSLGSGVSTGGSSYTKEFVEEQLTAIDVIIQITKKKDGKRVVAVEFFNE